MSKFKNTLNWNKLQEIKEEIVPALFTEHQFNLLEKKAKKEKLTASEKVEFSRSVSKRLKAINIIAGKENNWFVYGKEKMITERIDEAKTLIRQFSRQFKDKPILIGGSFLHSKKYNDIDIFVIEKYEKEDYKKDNYHINYLQASALESLFFNSLSKICISNFDLSGIKVEENITINQVISKYQEIRRDFSANNNSWAKIDLREFIVDCYYSSNKIILDSSQLKSILNNILYNKKKNKLIQKIFIQAILMGFESKKIKAILTNIIKSYKYLIREYKNKAYYQELIGDFQEVLNCAN
ncbi:hypothetical protein J4437_01735 [Candidatus Woesearchaeota archaeon]|nr:hypothetical protein [Candidatus Woesearchaeota archaeon]